MAREHGLTLLDSEMHEMERIINDGRSVLVWQPTTERPDADISVVLAFADGEMEMGSNDGERWRSIDGPAYLPDDQPVAWAHVPEVPPQFLTQRHKGTKETPALSASAPLRETTK
jgi:hypothetical protein